MGIVFKAIFNTTMEIWFGSKEGQKNRLLSLDKFGSARRLPPAPLAPAHGGDSTPEFIKNIIEDNQMLRAQMTASLMAMTAASKSAADATAANTRMQMELSIPQPIPMRIPILPEIPQWHQPPLPLLPWNPNPAESITCYACRGVGHKAMQCPTHPRPVVPTSSTDTIVTCALHNKRRTSNNMFYNNRIGVWQCFRSSRCCGNEPICCGYSRSNEPYGHLLLGSVNESK